MMAGWKKIRITQRRASFMETNYASIREAALRQYAITYFHSIYGNNVSRKRLIPPSPG
jgi:hypothetical protein